MVKQEPDRKTLRLLVVDDSPDDAELAVMALRKAGYRLKNQRVQDVAGMQSALNKGEWDVVVCEHALTHFGAQMALDLLRSAGLDPPFIVLTRHIQDGDLVKIMHAGAHDVILKSQSARIVPAIERELRVAEERRAYREATRRLNEMENKHRAIVEGSHEAIGYCQDGMHIDANKPYLELFGYQDQSELEGIPILNLIEKSDHARFKEFLRKGPQADSPQTQEFVALKHDGARIPIEVTVSPIVLNGESCTQLLVSDVSKRRAVESKLEYLSQHDPLTGLFNRHHFLQELTKTVDRIKRGDGGGALLYIDLEQLKDINNALGYGAGDRLLIKIARLFREQLGEDALLARFGGDEFAALLLNHSPSRVREMADGLQASLKENAFTEGDKSYRCECTLSISLIDRSTESAQKLLAQAYQATQRAKPQAPQAQVAAAPAGTEPKARKAAAPAKSAATPVTVDWLERLQSALQKDEFTLTYQPIINLHGDPAEYFEVLVRLTGRGDELIAAGEFMPAAEQYGLTEAIDRWVVRNSVEALSALHKEGRTSTLFVNVCPSVFKDIELVRNTQRQLHAAGIKPEHLVFEAEETALTANVADASIFIKAVKKVGCRFSVDDFGRNQNTVEALRGLPVDFLKIDGALVRNLQDPVAQSSLQALVEVARAMGAKAVAKSVEKAENLALLWKFGIDYVQGYYFQQADTQAQYEFAGETELSSDAAPTPHWATSTIGR